MMRKLFINVTGCRHESRKPEVAKFDNPQFRHENIFRLNVSMNDLKSQNNFLKVLMTLQY